VIIPLDILVELPRRGIGPSGQHDIEKRGHTSMPRARFESTIPMFELYRKRLVPRDHWNRPIPICLQ